MPAVHACRLHADCMNVGLPIAQVVVVAMAMFPLYILLYILHDIDRPIAVVVIALHYTICSRGRIRHAYSHGRRLGTEFGGEEKNI